MRDQLPPDFDWVSARYRCSATAMFEALRERAKQNVEKWNDLRRCENKPPDANFQASVPGVFSVFRGQAGGLAHTVRFRLDRSNIVVEGEVSVPVKFRGTLTLTDEGHCKLKVNGDELDEWQILRRALEPLLFDLKDWEV